MYVEELLFEKARRCTFVDVRCGVEAIESTQSCSMVNVTATRIETGERLTFMAEHVVDCSGKRSNIRRGLGIRYGGNAQKEENVFLAGRFLNAWIRAPEIYNVAPAIKTSWFNLTINADKSTRGVLVAMDGKGDFVLTTEVSNEHCESSSKNVVDTVRKMAGDDKIPIQVLDQNSWTAGSASVVDRYQADRVFLAGDAVHVFTPAGAFGLNTGVDDAHNLAWKLAAVHQGWGGPKLLHSYELERRRVGLRNTTTSHKSVGGWSEPVISDKLEHDGPEGEAERAAMARQSYVTGTHLNVPGEEDFVGIQLGSRYDGSPLISPDGEPPIDSWPETFTRYEPSSVPGGRLPHLWLEDEHVFGASIFDWLGRGFTMIRVSSKNIDIGALRGMAENKGIPFEVLDVARPEAVTLYQKSLLLVRPDRYIAWRGNELPKDCGALLDRVCGFA